MEPRYPMLEKKMVDEWTDDDVESYVDALLNDLSDLAEKDPKIYRILHHVIAFVLFVSSIDLTKSLSRERALSKEIDKLRSHRDRKEHIEEVVEDHVEFQVGEFDKHYKNALNRMRKQIESLSIRMDRLGGNE